MHFFYHRMELIMNADILTSACRSFSSVLATEFPLIRPLMCSCLTAWRETFTNSTKNQKTEPFIQNLLKILKDTDKKGLKMLSPPIVWRPGCSAADFGDSEEPFVGFLHAGQVGYTTLWHNPWLLPSSHTVAPEKIWNTFTTPMRF